MMLVTAQQSSAHFSALVMKRSFAMTYAELLEQTIASSYHDEILTEK